MELCEVIWVTIFRRIDGFDRRSNFTVFGHDCWQSGTTLLLILDQIYHYRYASHPFHQLYHLPLNLYLQ